jgi:hypothetical protein
MPIEQIRGEESHGRIPADGPLAVNAAPGMHHRGAPAYDARPERPA